MCPSWYDNGERPKPQFGQEFDPDAIERPEPYTDEEWASTEGATDHPTQFERVQDAGYEAGDPKGYSIL